MGDEETDTLIVFVIGAVAKWIIETLLIIIILTRRRVAVLSSSVQFDDQIDVSDDVQGWQEDVENQDDQDCLHLPRCHLSACHFRRSEVSLTVICVN